MRHMTLLGLAVILVACLPPSSASEAREHLRERVWALDDADLIVYSPDEPRYSVTVFTDVNCPFCREMHRQLDDFLMWGIRIRFAAFPTIDNAFEQMTAVWCSEDRHEALKRAKRGEPVDAPACENPVGNQLDLGLSLRFFGTPAIVTPRGNVRYGRTSAAELFEILEREAGD
jgi:thiol:disulfide interchange protein DsbC